jgi:hypothetical protein
MNRTIGLLEATGMIKTVGETNEVEKLSTNCQG